VPLPAGERQALVLLRGRPPFVGDITLGVSDRSNVILSRASTELRNRSRIWSGGQGGRRCEPAARRHVFGKVEPNIRMAEVTFIETRPARVDYASLGPLARLDWRWKGGISVEVDGGGGVVRGPEFSASWAPERLVWPGLAGRTSCRAWPGPPIRFRRRTIQV